MALSRISGLLSKITKTPILSERFVKKNVPYQLQSLFIKDKATPLGRWKIPKIDDDKYNYDKIHSKAIDASVDHCGPCGNDHIEKPNK